MNRHPFVFHPVDPVLWVSQTREIPPHPYKLVFFFFVRALWDESRRQGASWKDTMRAVLYEVQPIRFQRARRQHIQWMSTGSWAVAAATAAVGDVCRAIPSMTKGILQFLWQLKVRHWMAVLVLVGYCFFVRFMHEYVITSMTSHHPHVRLVVPSRFVSHMAHSNG